MDPHSNCAVLEREPCIMSSFPKNGMDFPANEKNFERVPDLRRINEQYPVTFYSENCPLPMKVMNPIQSSNGGLFSQLRQGFYWEKSQHSKTICTSASIGGGHYDQLSNREFNHHPRTFLESLRLLKDSLSTLKGHHTQQSNGEIGPRYPKDMQTNGSHKEHAGSHLKPQEPDYFNRFLQNARAKQPKRNRPFKGKICTLCFQNGERRSVFSNHTLKDEKGNAKCPVLRSYVCQNCGATGDEAHTKAYCPLLKSSSVPLAILLKSTPRDSYGRWRY